MGVRINFNRTTAEVGKDLQHKMKVLNIGSRSSFSSMGQYRAGMRLSEYSSGSGASGGGGRRSTAISQAQKAKEERDELKLYVFKTMSRNKALSFKKLAGEDFPLRHLPSE